MVGHEVPFYYVGFPLGKRCRMRQDARAATAIGCNYFLVVYKRGGEKKASSYPIRIFLKYGRSSNLGAYDNVQSR